MLLPTSVHLSVYIAFDCSNNSLSVLHLFFIVIFILSFLYCNERGVSRRYNN